MRKHKSEAPNIFLTILKGCLIALSISLIGILIFAFILRFAPISDGAISPINQVIKGISVLVGTILALKKSIDGFVYLLQWVYILFYLFASILNFLHLTFNVFPCL